MGYQAAFSYGALSDAAKQAGKAASRLEDYQSELEKKVINKLSSYSGRSCGYLDEARRFAASKYTALGSKNVALDSYKTAVESMANQCRAVDSGVASRIETLCGEFTTRHGIHIGAVENFFTRGKTSLKNSSWFGRASGDVANEIKDSAKEAWSDFKHWYTYEGGKYALWENLKTALAVAATVAGAVIAFATAGTALAVAAAIVGAVSAIYTVTDGITNMHYNCAAAEAAKNGDPTLAHRLNQINSFSDHMRKSYSQSDHDIANMYDTSKAVVDTVKVVLDVADLAGSGIEWITNGKFDSGKMDLWEVSGKDLKDGWSAKMSMFKERIGSFKEMVKAKDWGLLRKTSGTLAQEFGRNVWEGLTDNYKTWSDKTEEPIKRAKAAIKTFSNATEWTGKTLDRFVFHTDVNGGDYGKDVFEGLRDLAFTGVAGRAGNDNDIAVTFGDVAGSAFDSRDAIKDFAEVAEHRGGGDFRATNNKTFRAAQRIKTLRK